MLDGFDFSKMGSIFEEAQKKAQELQEESKNKTFTAKSGGGLVSISMNGSSEVIDITIDDSLLSDKDAMQILLMSAVNDAVKMVEDDRKLLASKMLGSFGAIG
ncbi:MAG: YbaB/EbfC family nucleoid-associated protein [Campylobacteraceae bacterium]|jgi:DNA-binding YbaB/EbfC family protein|nr:YbaB/EbfC family nucleoid-associated protein [Campylobacteraceae bacterium]